jgi:hypothetical protein
MAPGLIETRSLACAPESEPSPSKRRKTSAAANFQNDDEVVAIALPSHPLGVKPAGNAYTASENIKSRCGSFARLPDELLSHILESFEADTLIRLGSTCRALYAYTRLDEFWRALFVRYVFRDGTCWLCVLLFDSSHRPVISLKSMVYQSRFGEKKYHLRRPVKSHIC